MSFFIYSSCVISIATTKYHGRYISNGLLGTEQPTLPWYNCHSFVTHLAWSTLLYLHVNCPTYQFDRFYGEGIVHMIVRFNHLQIYVEELLEMDVYSGSLVWVLDVLDTPDREQVEVNSSIKSSCCMLDWITCGWKGIAFPRLHCLLSEIDT